MKKTRIASLFVSVLLLLPLYSMGDDCRSGVVLGEFNISLGKYSSWNSMRNTSHCNTVQVDCSISPVDTKVGNTTKTVDTLGELGTLVYEFGFECLDKAAVLNDKGQQAFKDVYIEDLGFQGTLWNHFQSEANRCWNHYFGIYEELKNKMCVTKPLFNF